jgi:hypothetical protein
MQSEAQQQYLPIYADTIESLHTYSCSITSIPQATIAYITIHATSTYYISGWKVV